MSTSLMFTTRLQHDNEVYIDIGHVKVLGLCLGDQGGLNRPSPLTPNTA